MSDLNAFLSLLLILGMVLGLGIGLGVWLAWPDRRQQTRSDDRIFLVDHGDLVESEDRL
ncbi:membrane protein [Gordonia phage Finkle]|uniref:Membrane protein n=1 Tax=Gordonia phage Finkle TaxID=2926099 RepID=A0A9E7NKM3_9CAUD|nr:membrane protein [Gordonia phage Finkle]UTN92969.1 membrane protein [Gordonia phage Finkle]